MKYISTQAAAVQLQLPFGSDRDATALLVPDVARHLGELTLQPAPDHPQEYLAAANFRADAALPPGSIEARNGFIVLGRREAPTLPDAVQLTPGDVIHLRHRTIGTDVVVLSNDTIRVGGATIRIPRITVELPDILPQRLRRWETFRYPDIWTRTYPVAAIGVSVRSDDEQSSLLATAGAIKSFLFFETRALGLRGRLSLMLLDPEVEVESRDGNTRRLRPSVELLRASPSSASTRPSVTVRFCQTGRESPYFFTSFERTGISERRSGSLAIATEPIALEFRFDTPEVLNFTESELVSLAARSSRDGPDVIPLSLTPDGLHQQSMSFSHVPRAFESGGQALIERRDGEILVLTPIGQRLVTPGESFWLGDQMQALVQIDNVYPLGFGLLYLLACTGLSFAAVTALPRPVRSWASPLFLGVHAILVVRLLFAIKAFNQSPFEFESVALSWFALAFVPLALASSIVLTRGRRALMRMKWPYCGLAIVAAGAAAAVFGRTLATVGFAMAILPLLLFWNPAMERAQAALSRLWARLARSDAGPTEGRRVLWFAVTSSALLLAFRGVLAVGGFRERFPLFGVPLAVSILFTPISLLILSAICSRWSNERWRSPFLFALSMIALLLMGGLASAVVSSDLGLLIVLAPPIVTALWIGLRESPMKRYYQVFRVAVVVTVALVYSWRLFPAAESWLLQRVSHTSTETERNAYRDWDRNRLRILYWTYPSAVEGIGRRASEDLVLMGRVLSIYTRAGLWGDGYMARQVPVSLLRGTSLREHVPAVFVASEFGHVGVVGVAAIYLVPLLIVVPLAKRRLKIRGSPIWLALFAATAFSAASVYMIAANYDLVPFTGKNVYLLGLDSFGDLLESTLLLCVVALGLGRTKVR